MGLGLPGLMEAPPFCKCLRLCGRGNEPLENVGFFQPLPMPVTPLHSIIGQNQSRDLTSCKGAWEMWVSRWKAMGSPGATFPTPQLLLFPWSDFHHICAEFTRYLFSLN